MISLEQYRRSIGVFCGGTHYKARGHDVGVNHNSAWTGLSYRLFVCAVVSWTLYGELCLLRAAIHQPVVNTLLLANDVELNPGPGIEEQLAAINESIIARFNELSSEISHLSCTMRSMVSTLEEVKVSVENVRSQVAELDRRQQVLRLDIDANSEAISSIDHRMDTRLRAFEEALERQEQYSRRENVILHGIQESANEDYVTMRKKVTDLLNTAVTSRQWSEDAILRAHRLGKPGGTKPRPVIVRFTQFMDKLDVLKARPEMRSAGVGVSNDLTVKQRQELRRVEAKGLKGYFKKGRMIVNNPRRSHANLDDNSSSPPPPPPAPRTSSPLHPRKLFSDVVTQDLST